MMDAWRQAANVILILAPKDIYHHLIDVDTLVALGRGWYRWTMFLVRAADRSLERQLRGYPNLL